MKPTSKHFHQIVWIDHQLAQVYAVTHDDLIELAIIRAPDEDRGHVHHKAGTMGSGHVAPAQQFLREIATQLEDAQEVLIVGPADAKHALRKYIALNTPLLGKRVIGVEPLDKCGHRELKDFATLFFRQTDRMCSTPP